MQHYPLISLQPLPYFFTFMRGIVIHDNMQFLILLRLRFNLLEKFKKLFVGMFLIALTGDATGGNIKCCKQGTSAVSFIIMRYGSTASFL